MKKRAYTNGATKRLELPHKFVPGFIEQIDKRTVIYDLLNTSYCEVVGDMGGAEGMSHVKQSLAERYVFMEFWLRTLENKILSNPKKTVALVGRWVQAMNTFMGLSKTLGLERRAMPVVSLQSYVKSKKKKK
ncbi:MAG: hypothetical protein FVQ85_21020 [Planctomycetes bacterium]|nr:hypothetical protein [Planctomycetota bacterium]